MALKYQRILLKISGEALGGEKGTGFDEPTMDAICGGVKKAHDLGVQIGIVWTRFSAPLVFVLSPPVSFPLCFTQR
ncbi:MAG: hypothetical protein ACLTHC_05775 [Faecalibacterium sp.]